MESTGFSALKSPSNVYLDGSVTVSFDATLDSSTVNNNTVLLYKVPDYTRRNVYLSVSGSDIVLNFEDAKLEPNSDWQIIIVSGANGVKSSGGDTLTENEIIDFSTQDLLTPTAQDDTSAEELQDELNYDKADEPVVGDVEKEIVVPDLNIQGDIEDFEPCSEDTLNGADTFVEDSGLPSVVKRLNLVGSIPREYTVGVTDVSELTIVWDRNVKENSSSTISFTYQDLPDPEDPFSNTEVESSGIPTVIGDRIIAEYVNPDDLTNKEFTVVIKAGKVSSINDKYTNVTETINFAGKLVPMLCTFQMARQRAGMWGVEFSRKAIYHYNLIIHRESVHALKSRGYDTIEDVPEGELPVLSRYVCCYAALQMLGTGASGESGGATGGLFVKRRDLPGVSISYDEHSTASGSANPYNEMLKSIIECLKETGITPLEGFENIVIDHGVKSKNDYYFIRRRRL